jgi:hypothetical protein
MLLLGQSKRTRQLAAMLLIGDGVLAILQPRRDAYTWRIGPKPWKHLMHKLEAHPTLTRIIGAAQVVGGICWAFRQHKKS